MKPGPTPRELLKHAKYIRKKWKCMQCGSCCKLKIGLKGDDWDRWKDALVNSKLGTTYPMRGFCNVTSKKYSKLGDMFFHPITGEELEGCPFIDIRNGKHFCFINDPKIKPNNCKDFNDKFIDLRCNHIKKMINIMYELNFNTKEEEKLFYLKLNDEFLKVQLTSSFFQGMYELTKILSE